ncbi:MAG TPA: hypothetical protein PKU97_01750, partial [Kofleriaceae bacterium]|nr:hypothetical protein [Kofleriaceae bacterium]
MFHVGWRTGFCLAERKQERFGARIGSTVEARRMTVAKRDASERWVGIDLGTTNSAVAVLEGG